MLNLNFTIFVPRHLISSSTSSNSTTSTRHTTLRTLSRNSSRTSSHRQQIRGKCLPQLLLSYKSNRRSCRHFRERHGCFISEDYGAGARCRDYELAGGAGAVEGEVGAIGLEGLR